MFSKFILFLLLFFVDTSFAQNRMPFNKRPNIIYIYADDLGIGDIGAYGQEKIKTPNIDRLAREGMLFTRHYSSAPVCAPSRAALMTGKHTGHGQIRGNYELGGFEDSNEGGQMPLQEGTFTIGKMLQKAGYVTGAVGKWGLGFHNNTGNPNAQGFDYFYGYYCQKQAHNHYPTHLWENGKWDSLRNIEVAVHHNDVKDSTDSDAFNRFIGKDYSTTKFSEKAIAFVQKNYKKPFFLYLPFSAPHVSLQAPVEEVEAYIGQFPEKMYLGVKGYAPNRNPLSTYAAMVTYMDKQIGQLMDALKALHIDNQTIILFSSDNGATFDVGGTQTPFFNSTMNLRGRKAELYEGGIRAPMLVRWPGKIVKGSKTDLLSAQYDVLATLAEISGQNIVQTDGISFLATLLSHPKVQEKHAYLYFEFPEKDGQIAIVVGKMKGVKSNIKKNKAAVWELYDLEKDPYEKNNIIAQYPEKIAEFDAIVVKNHVHPVIKEWGFVDDFLKK